MLDMLCFYNWVFDSYHLHRLKNKHTKIVKWIQKLIHFFKFSNSSLFLQKKKFKGHKNQIRDQKEGVNLLAIKKNATKCFI